MGRNRAEKTSQQSESNSDMDRRKFVISIYTFFLGLAFLAQPAIAAECAGSTECIPGHPKSHHPSPKDIPSCDCSQTTQLLHRYVCMPQNRSQFAPDINLSSHIGDLISSHFDIGSLDADWRCTAILNLKVAEPLAHRPIFLLNQSFLC